MDTNIGSLKIPAASMSLFDTLSVLLFIVIYRRIIIPLLSCITSKPRGLSELHRMGIGLVISNLAMVSAGFVEIERLKRVSVPHEPSSLSVLWQIPQYALIGASEVFMYVGQLEFFNGQAPDGLKRFGSSLCMASIFLGNYVSIMLVTMVMQFTTSEEVPGWIPGNLNYGNLDRFYFMLALLTVADLGVFVVCGRWYKYIKMEKNEDEDEKHLMI